LEGEKQKLEANQKADARSQTSEDVGEEAAVATTAETTATAVDDNVAPPPPDEEGFVWPEGAAPQSEAASMGATEQAVVANTPLPSLDELVKRIPAAARDTLDDLFRARFVAVKRVEQSSLKS
jgi:hypothetical protein